MLMNILIYKNFFTAWNFTLELVIKYFNRRTNSIPVLEIKR